MHSAIGLYFGKEGSHISWQVARPCCKRIGVRSREQSSLILTVDKIEATQLPLDANHRGAGPTLAFWREIRGKRVEASSLNFSIAVENFMRSSFSL